MFSNLLKALTHAIAPVLLHTAQEASQAYSSQDVKTVFHEQWFKDTMKLENAQSFLHQFSVFDTLSDMQELR